MSPAPTSPPRRRLAVAALCLLSVVVHLVVLYLPGEDVPAVGFEVPGLDKAIHVLAFGVPVLLAVLWARRAWPAVLLLVHAPVSEVLQVLQARGRTGDPGDVLADVAGVALGAAAAWAILHRDRRAPAPSGAGGGEDV